MLNHEISVDASLSNWLVSPQTTPVNKAGSVPCYARNPDRTTSQISVISHEDRPILGAFTIEDIRQFSATSSPRKLPSRISKTRLRIVAQSLPSKEFQTQQASIERIRE
ncbi:hypothetical protein Lalb_Chr06g0170651 [Lupinus albus]|uniref:Uncharacterized protein n=1 Tax=Lupinus albus TaxID=3870 RepID=A0A6A4QF49_LUPAL|nr:hypothetical protein Lalb_Chr06g0170651 [Lupinus albus]